MDRWGWHYVVAIIVSSICASSCISPNTIPVDPARNQCTPIDGKLEDIRSYLQKNAPEGYIDNTRVYGMGLTYASHIKETGSGFDPATPPVFRKAVDWKENQGKAVTMPSERDLEEEIEKIEEDFPWEKVKKLSPLLDYEVELAFVLLKEITKNDLTDENFNPLLGFFIANDISARSIQILGEGRKNKYAYWSAAKSFPTFMPASRKMWVPEKGSWDRMPCITLKTYVNGKIRQCQSVSDIIYTPKEMVTCIFKEFMLDKMEYGDVVLTGTPSGVALQMSKMFALISTIIKPDRFAKLDTVTKFEGKGCFTAEKDCFRFLKVGDVVKTSGSKPCNCFPGAPGEDLFGCEVVINGSR